MLADRIERRFDAELSIIVKSDVAVGGVRIAPRDHEDGEAFAREIFHQRVLRRQIENVVLHDPGRHDQNRLRMHLFGGRIVLDQLDQFVAEHDLAARRGDGFADDEIAGRDRTKARRHQAHPVAAEILPAAHEIVAAALERFSAALPDWSRQNWKATSRPASAGPKTRRSPRSASPRRARPWSRCATIVRRAERPAPSD